MSYEKVKRISISEKGISVTSACNNVSPIHYESWEYKGNTLDDKLKSLHRELSSGNLQMNKACVFTVNLDGNKRTYTPTEIERALEVGRDRIVNTTLQQSFLYRQNREDGLRDLRFEEYFKPFIYGQKTDYNAVISKIEAFDKETGEIYRNLTDTLKIKDQTLIQSAIRLNDDYVMAESDIEKKIFIADRADYKPGLLSNTSRCITLDADEKMWGDIDFLSSVATDGINEKRMAYHDIDRLVGISAKIQRQAELLKKPLLCEFMQKATEVLRGYLEREEEEIER